MLNNTTLAAVLLICAGIIHNYSFMCRKLPKEKLKIPYPSSTVGMLLFDLSWLLMVAYGFYLTLQISTMLGMVAAGIYFLLFPFLLQPPLARLLGFRSLSDFVNSTDTHRNREN